MISYMLRLTDQMEMKAHCYLWFYCESKHTIPEETDYYKAKKFKELNQGENVTVCRQI